jgi:hypothetical protein
MKKVVVLGMVAALALVASIVTAADLNGSVNSQLWNAQYAADQKADKAMNDAVKSLLDTLKAPAAAKKAKK